MYNNSVEPGRRSGRLSVAIALVMLGATGAVVGGQLWSRSASPDSVLVDLYASSNASTGRITVRYADPAHTEYDVLTANSTRAYTARVPTGGTVSITVTPDISISAAESQDVRHCTIVPYDPSLDPDA